MGNPKQYARWLLTASLFTSGCPQPEALDGSVADAATNGADAPHGDGDTNAPDAWTSDVSASPDAGPDAPEFYERMLLRGAAQKGPLVVGSTVMVAPVDAMLLPTGTVYLTETINNLGEFEVLVPTSSIVMIEASGYSRSELNAADSPYLTLRAYYEPTTSSATQRASVNIITHLTSPRIRHLVRTGTTFPVARDQAEGELRAGLGIIAPSVSCGAIGTSSTVTEGDTMAARCLLATSVYIVVIAGSGVGETLQGLLNGIGADLEPDGTIASATSERIRGFMDLYRTSLAPDGSFWVAVGYEGTPPNIGFVVDTDLDGFVDALDTCAGIANPDQADADGDGVGDVCENCVSIPNANQLDSEADGVGDACDNCVARNNPDQADLDTDGVGDACDNCPSAANPDQRDGDGDFSADACDNCPLISNPGQRDTDRDGIGDVCDI